ncbi:MAG: hypothetical protein WC326_05730 [Candidatus Delongbacteria bacterium]
MHFIPGCCRSARRFLLLSASVLVLGAAALARDLVRPEPVGSMRKIWREPAAYVELDRLWQAWYDEYPSEDAYENWMYAARYAGNPQYEKLLDKGLRKYPGSPVLLYLKAVTQMVRHDPALRSSTLDYLQRAVALDPAYDDPWFSLVIEYMALERGKDLHTALERLLELGAVDDATLDYCHNMLGCLENGAVLITNGDMDTYPCWMLQQVMGVRPDVTVLNQSLLNTDWYAARCGQATGPGDWTTAELAELRRREMPCSDTLIERILRRAAREKRSVYFASTLQPSPRLKPLQEKGQTRGLALRVQPAGADQPADARSLAACWLESFRTEGLDSWSFRHGDPRRSCRSLAGNYANGLAALLEILPAGDRQTAALFGWYRDHLSAGIDAQLNRALAPFWEDVPEAARWLKDKGWKP